MLSYCPSANKVHVKTPLIEEILRLSKTIKRGTTIARLVGCSADYVYYVRKINTLRSHVFVTWGEVVSRRSIGKEKETPKKTPLKKSMYCVYHNICKRVENCINGEYCPVYKFNPTCARKCVDQFDEE